jgi:competence protein ComEC
VRIAGGIVGAIFAICYALLAGLTLPTQRALIMVLVVLIGLLARRQYPGSLILATALFAVLIHDPLAVLSQGFWLSFVAVGLILLTTARRIKRQRFDVFTIQLALSVGMLPLTLGLFGTSSLSAPLANLLAIPWVTAVVVPLTLLGVLMMPFEAISEGLLNLAAHSVDWMMTGLNALSSTHAMLSIPEIPSYLLLISFIGFLWLWLPAKFPARWLGLVLMMPLVFYRPAEIEQGSFDYHLLDVGQGLASVVQTKNHVLIYDTGPRSNDRFDTGKLVVLPFLRAKAIEKVDMMIISHEDNDHRGGANVIRNNIAIDRILSSDISLFPNIEFCTKGMKWTWDGVLFEILHPERDWQENDNNRSCVLRISNQFHSLLLTGDIQKMAENKLLESAVELKSEVMLMPHHGSKTSSLPSFISTVNPKLSLITTGYRNQFHLPNKKVLKRYKNREIEMMDTVKKGAISLQFPDSKKNYELSSYRDVYHRYWHKQ